MASILFLLPSNMIVRKDTLDGNIVVSGLDPMSLFLVLDEPKVAPLAAEVNGLV
jgi:hypothetical protein